MAIVKGVTVHPARVAYRRKISGGNAVRHSKTSCLANFAQPHARPPYIALPPSHRAFA